MFYKGTSEEDFDPGLTIFTGLYLLTIDIVTVIQSVGWKLYWKHYFTNANKVQHVYLISIG